MPTSNPPNSPFAGRDRCIEAHIERYRLTLPHVVSRTEFPEAQYPDRQEALRLAGDSLAALVRRGILAAYPLRHAKTKIFTPHHQRSSADAIEYDLAALWFCMLSSQPRLRLTAPEMQGLFPAIRPHHHIRHVAARGADGPYVLRLYPTKVGLKETVARLKRFASDAEKLRDEWFVTGDYGIALLVAEPDGVADAERAIASLGDRARIVVEHAPNTTTLPAALANIKP